MDYLLFLFILVIVIAIGYILSKPFTKSSDAQKLTEPAADFEDQYETLLREIKVIEQEYKDGTIDQEACLTQIDEKKKLAADLLRLIHPVVKDEIMLNQNAIGFEQAKDQPLFDPSAQGSYFCPQCGDQVLKSDKFCLHCGHRLRP